MKQHIHEKKKKKHQDDCMINLSIVLLFKFLALGDVAQGKSTYQSSDFENAFFSSLALQPYVDRNNYYSCTHTNREVKPWWAVTVGLHKIHSVELTNRADCCGQ